jgi:demethoxyubiquinone hydroxylase (CLK1/Coq7/Cat5 family)
VKAHSTDSRDALIRVLRAAYSGELAAAFAYAGHWRSLSNPDERDRIRAIEAEELHHRKLVGEMLEQLGTHPSRSREFIFRVIGRTLGPLCSFSGWLAPMWGAGFLESHNIVEYEVAARLAREGGHAELVDCLLEMAEVEWDHELYFRQQVLKHRLARFIPIWKTPPPKSQIRREHQRLAA